MAGLINYWVAKTICGGTHSIECNVFCSISFYKDYPMTPLW
jgi:hypothetical protein